MKRRVIKFGPDVVRQALIEWMESRGQEPTPPTEAEVRFTEDSVKLVWSEDETRSGE
jgi:hypothetical protein